MRIRFSPAALAVLFLLGTVLLLGSMGCEPPRGAGQGQATRNQAPPPPPGAPRTDAPAGVNTTLAGDPKLKSKVVGIWTNSTGPAGTGTVFTFLESGDYQTKVGMPPSEINGTWQLAGDTIHVKATDAEGKQNTILYKVHEVDEKHMVLVRDQKEPIVLFRL